MLPRKLKKEFERKIQNVVYLKTLLSLLMCLKQNQCNLVFVMFILDFEYVLINQFDHWIGSLRLNIFKDERGLNTFWLKRMSSQFISSYSFSNCLLDSPQIQIFLRDFKRQLLLPETPSPKTVYINSTPNLRHNH